MLRVFPQVLLATSLAVGMPAALVWGLAASGTVTSVPALVAVAAAAALLVSRAGVALWQRRPGGGDLVFGELMVWGWLRRLWAERRLANAISLIGRASDLEGLDREQRAERLERLSAALEARDPYTHGHSRRVARHSEAIARILRLPAQQVARVRTAAALHDVGKIETPVAVLGKDGTLTAEERAVIERHPTDGARMVAALGDEELTRSVLHHHERLDGSGYPAGLAGEGIPIGARIIAVGDTFDALASTRPYRSARSHRQALEVLARESGTRLDAEVVAAFVHRYSGARPLAVWAVLASGPERLGVLLGGGLNAASAAVAAAVAIAITALGVPQGSPDSTPGLTAQASAAQVRPMPARSSPALRPPARRPARERRPGGARPEGAAPGPTPNTAAAAGPAPTELPAGQPAGGTGQGPPDEAPASKPPASDDPGTDDAPPPGPPPDGGGGPGGGQGKGLHLLPHLPVGPHLPHLPGSGG